MVSGVSLMPLSRGSNQITIVLDNKNLVIRKSIRKDDDAQRAWLIQAKPSDTGREKADWCTGALVH